MRGALNVEHIGTILTIAGFILNLIVIVVGGTWKLSQVEGSLRKAIEESRKEIDDRIDLQSREFGETVAALRQKMHEVELWARDTFMRRDGFYKIKDEVTGALKEVRDELKTDLRRLEEKIDTKT
jgi:Sec-independent protein translocase protein TatA